ncbi:hypothetical protein QFZ28_000749 [Neobacillus niacini]|uniref:transposase n=1 Tax=Neobacillus niacini TaxID=86668 RepID=UPI002788F04C|nr:transposase [Neobacillus niacini]MDQ1000349.1 hypothetical protein [Neobacillus niacini]
MRKKQSLHNSVETKLEAVRQVLENKRPVAEVANELDLHRDTVNRWVILLLTPCYDKKLTYVFVQILTEMLADRKGKHALASPFTKY